MAILILTFFALSDMTQVDQLRARAENCDPSAGEEERGLHIWLATGGANGREGLTDTDLLRFIMFR